MYALCNLVAYVHTRKIFIRHKIKTDMNTQNKAAPALTRAYMTHTDVSWLSGDPSVPAKRFIPPRPAMKSAALSHDPAIVKSASTKMSLFCETSSSKSISSCGARVYVYSVTRSKVTMCVCIHLSLRVKFRCNEM